LLHLMFTLLDRRVPRHEAHDSRDNSVHPCMDDAMAPACSFHR